MASRAYAAQNAVLIAAECSSAEGLAAVIASCSPLAFQGMDESSAVNCHKRPLYPVFEASEETGDEDICDETAHHVEKKRRLSVEQVKSLEKNFELENKLEPDRKIQLAKELGLQPRQVAVWFQNRRARWKTKQLEKDYDVLKAEYDDLKSNYVDLKQEKDRLHDEVARLRERLCCDEKESEAGTCPQTKVKLEEDFKSVTSNEQADISAARSPICKVEVPNSLSTCKREGSFSSDSDASDILEAESPQPRFESEPAHQCSELTAAYTDAAALLYLTEDPYCRAFLPSVYQRPALKVEDGSDHSLEDQGAFSWWDWA